MIHQLEISRVIPVENKMQIEWTWRHYPTAQEIIDYCDQQKGGD